MSSIAVCLTEALELVAHCFKALLEPLQAAENK